MHYVQKSSLKETDIEMQDMELIIDEKFELMMRTDLQFTKAKY